QARAALRPGAVRRPERVRCAPRARDRAGLRPQALGRGLWSATWWSTIPSACTTPTPEVPDGRVWWPQPLFLAPLPTLPTPNPLQRSEYAPLDAATNSAMACAMEHTTHNRVVGGSNPPAATSPAFNTIQALPPICTSFHRLVARAFTVCC